MLHAFLVAFMKLSFLIPPPWIAHPAYWASLHALYPSWSKWSVWQVFCTIEEKNQVYRFDWNSFSKNQVSRAINLVFQKLWQSNRKTKFIVDCYIVIFEKPGFSSDKPVFFRNNCRRLKKNRFFSSIVKNTCHTLHSDQLGYWAYWVFWKTKFIARETWFFENYYNIQIRLS